MGAAENKEIIRNMFAELSKGNADAFLNTLADDVNFTLIGSTKFSGVFKGKQEFVEKVLAPLGAQLENGLTMHVENLIAEGDNVVLQGHGESMTKSGKAYNNTYAQVFRLENGQGTASHGIPGYRTRQRSLWESRSQGASDPASCPNPMASQESVATPDRTCLIGRVLSPVRYTIREDDIQDYLPVAGEEQAAFLSGRSSPGGRLRSAGLFRPRLPRLWRSQALLQAFDWERDFLFNYRTGTAMFGEQELEYLRPLYVGETLTVRSEVADVYEKKGENARLM